MKIFTLVAAVALLALAVPALAGETSEAPPATTLELQNEAQLTPIDLLPAPNFYCSDVNGYSCPTLGATRKCADACGNSLSCICVQQGGWRVWRCGIPC